MLSSLLCSVVEALMRTRVCVCVIRYLYGHKAYSMTYRSGKRRQATDVFTQVHYVQQQNKTEAASELHITLEVRGRTTAHAFSVTALFKVWGTLSPLQERHALEQLAAGRWPHDIRWSGWVPLHFCFMKCVLDIFRKTKVSMFHA